MALENIQDYLTRVSASVAKFHRNLVSQRDVSHLRNVSKWMDYIDVSTGVFMDRYNKTELNVSDVKAGSEAQEKITGNGQT